MSSPGRGWPQQAFVQRPPEWYFAIARFCSNWRPSRSQMITENADVVYVAFRDSVAAVAPRAAVDSGACSQIHVWANVGAVGADFVGIPGATGTLAVDKRPIHM